MIILEPTAALVMDLAADVFRSKPLTHAYFERLDLSSAAEMIAEHKAIGVYAPTCEAVSNRKVAMHHLATECLVQRSGPVQVVLLAAGKSPLGLELCVEQRAKVARVFEVDVSPFTEKAALYTELSPECSGLVTFIEQDILSETLIPRLTAHGYDASRPTLLILEGISHYIDHAACARVIGQFASSRQETDVILEYGVPIETLTERVRAHVAATMALVEKRFQQQGMTKYTAAWLTSMFAGHGGALTRIIAMDEMERLRLGENRYFPEPNSGALALAVGRL